MQRSSGNHILNAKDFYLWAKDFCKETEVFFSSKESYDIAVVTLKERFEKALTIAGTLQFHAFIPINKNTLKLQKTSSSKESKLFIMKEKKTAIKKKIDKKTAPQGMKKLIKRLDKKTQKKKIR